MNEKRLIDIINDLVSNIVGEKYITDKDTLIRVLTNDIGMSEEEIHSIIDFETFSSYFTK